MKKPEKRKLWIDAPRDYQRMNENCDQEKEDIYMAGFNECYDLYEQYHAWDIKTNYIHKDGLSVERIADDLHTAGLNAFVDYKSMGKSGDMWSDFRREIATELSNQLKEVRK